MKKTVLFTLLFITTFLCYSQKITLSKNGTFKKYTIALPGYLTIKYQGDSVLNNHYGKVIFYEFPQMKLLVKKKDTLNLDVRKITEVKYTSKAVAFYYSSAILVNLFCIPIVIISLKEKIYEAAFFFAIPVGLTYFLVKEGERTFNTKKEWRFN